MACSSNQLSIEEIQSIVDGREIYGSLVNVTNIDYDDSENEDGEDVVILCNDESDDDTALVPPPSGNAETTMITKIPV